jgi:hypothetical protein
MSLFKQYEKSSASFYFQYAHRYSFISPASRKSEKQKHIAASKPFVMDIMGVIVCTLPEYERCFPLNRKA